jgi:hypothetical protein
MRGHAPYDEATAHYRAISPLYGKGSVAAGVRKVVETNPERVVALLKPSNPTGAEQLVHLLTTQAEAGGGGAEGRETLQAVQAAWIHQKLIRPGIEKLGKNLDALPDDFRQAFLGDPHAAEILENLRLISTAYGAAIRTEQTVAGQASDLASSSLMRRAKAPVADAIRMFMLAPHGSYWGLESGARLLHGPTAQDLITHATASPWATRQLVYALTSSKSSQAVADLVRAWGLLQDEPEPEGQSPSRVGQPPSRVGQPPPR